MTDHNSPPEGFELFVFPRPVPFIDLIGPVYIRMTEAGADAGAWVTENHRNGGRMAHGGFLLTLADIATGRAATELVGADSHTLHMSLSMDFYAPAPVSSWVEARARIERQGRSVLFAVCDFFVGEEKIGHATASLKTRTPKSKASPRAE